MSRLDRPVLVYPRRRSSPQSVPSVEELPVFTRFTASEKLGVGTYGSVYKVRSNKNNRIYALKVTKKLHVVQREYKYHLMAVNSAHPNIVKLFGLIEDSIHGPLLQLEYCGGGTLHDAVERGAFIDEHGVLNESLAQKVFVGVLRGAMHIHSNSVCHVDLKPGNILLTKDMIPKIADFGLAVGHRICRPAGTKSYMAPEVHDSYHGQKEAVNMLYHDIWCLGIILIEMLTGDLPWSRASTTSTRYRRFKKLDLQERKRYLLDMGVPTGTPLDVLLGMLHITPALRWQAVDILREFETWAPRTRMIMKH